MPVKGTLSVGDIVEIAFSAHHANVGSTIVNTGYIPKPATPPAPVVPPVVLVAAAASAVQHTTVGPAFTLVIDVDVPPGGGGQLDVRVNGSPRDAGSIGNDCNWSYIILGADDE